MRARKGINLKPERPSPSSCKNTYKNKSTVISKPYLGSVNHSGAMALAVFSFVVAAEILLLLVIAVSALFPKHRIWPPPKKDTWQQWVSWTLFTISMFGMPLLGILNFESLGQGHWTRFLVGGLACLIGFAIDIWGTRTLTAQQSLGGKGKIITEGPYRFTRNPQYVGFILIYAGVILISYSFMAAVTGALLVLAFLTLPFSEEPWLRLQYGEPFIEYCKNVPRFIGIRSFKQALQHR